MRKMWEKFQSLSLLMAFPLAKTFFIPFSREAFMVYKAYINHENHLKAKKEKKRRWGGRVKITKIIFYMRHETQMETFSSNRF